MTKTWAQLLQSAQRRPRQHPPPLLLRLRRCLQIRSNRLLRLLELVKRNLLQQQLHLHPLRLPLALPAPLLLASFCPASAVGAAVSQRSASKRFVRASACRSSALCCAWTPTCPCSRVSASRWHPCATATRSRANNPCSTGVAMPPQWPPPQPVLPLRQVCLFRSCILPVRVWHV